MEEEYQSVRRRLEDDGYVLTDDEYRETLNYARRKAGASGKGDDYIPVLLLDVIREYVFCKCVNRISMAALIPPGNNLNQTEGGT